MNVVKVCRICLIMDVKMYDLQTHPLETYFGTIVGVSMSAINLPQKVCFECAALVKKCYNFKLKCLRGQEALYQIQNTSGQITKEDIEKINRRSLQLNSNLNINIISQESVINHVYDEDSFKIKKESVVEDNKYNIDESNDIVLPDVSFDTLAFADVPDVYFKENIKDEDCFKDLTEDANGNEELTLDRINKRKIMTKNEKIKLDDILDPIEPLSNIKVADKVEKRITRKQPKKVPIKLKAVRVKKSDLPNSRMKTNQKKKGPENTDFFDDDIDDLEKYATVIKLSIEEQMEEINKRQHSRNYINAAFQCTVCYKGFLTTESWQHHVRKHEPSAGDKECPICKLRFQTKKLQKDHSRSHEKKYACKSCNYISSHLTQAKRHERWHKGITYKCQYCNEISSKWTSHLSHIRIKHPSEFICDICGYSFVSKLGLTMHKTMMHKDVTKTIGADVEMNNDNSQYCEQCDVKFMSPEAFKRHMVTSAKHTKTTHLNNGCRECGEMFDNSEELKIHHRKVHTIKHPKNYGKKPTDRTWPAKCEHCSEEIPNGRVYWNHFRKIHPDKSYPIQKNHVCDICGKSFKNITFLAYHSRLHTGEKPFKCTVCGKTFYTKTNLSAHEKTHSDARPYPCTVCFKAFKCKGALDKHFLRHTGVKRYVCDICGKAFIESSSRKLHILTVHQKQPAPYISRSRLLRRNKAQLEKEHAQTSLC